MTHYSSQLCFWYEYQAPANTRVISHAQDDCSYAVTELTDANGEGWSYRLQLLQQGPQPARPARPEWDRPALPVWDGPAFLAA